jgi:hypothetical protein
MSTATTAVPSSSKPLAVNSHLLLALYGFIPLSILVVLVDQLFLSGVLKDQYLPSNPATLMWWAIIFNFPHIVSSLVTLADKEYIQFYKKRFTKALTIIIAVVLGINILIPLLFPGVLSTASTFLFLVFFSGYTMYHVLSQQFGIGMMLMKVRPTTSYEVWRALATVASTLMYGMVFVIWTETPVLGEFSAFDIMKVIAGIFCVLTVMQGIYITRTSQRDLGKWYVYSNLLMLVTSYGLLLAGYGFFVIAIPRFVHDLTAFIIYSTHDQNRNRDQVRNYFYRALKFIPIPILFLCPILAIVIAHSVQCGSLYIDLLLGFDKAAFELNECPFDRYYQPTGINNGIPPYMQFWAQIMFICGLFHYHIEAFVWKREAIHRHSVAFT